jgi:hypothetical protein
LLSDIHFYQFISVTLISEADVQSQVDANINLVRTSTSIELTSFSKSVKMIYRSSYLVSALGTNALVHRSFNETYFSGNSYPFAANSDKLEFCDEFNSVGPAFFMSAAGDHYEDNDKFQFGSYAYEELDSNSSATVQGFFGGCFPFDALLASTLQCLYDVQCLSILPDYFPRFKHVCIEFMLSILTTLHFF